MAKSVSLFIVAAVLLAATVLTNASSYTVTTTVKENDEMMMMVNQGKECRQEMQQHRRQLRNCEQFFSEQMGGQGQGGGQYFGRTVMNQMPEQMQHFYGCCQALQSIGDQQCVCQSLEKIARSAGGGSSSSRGQGEQFAMARASVFPLFCGLGHMCQFESSYGEI